MMLESVIYPYILSSIIGGLGGLSRARAMRLFKVSWVVYVVLWTVVFAAIFALAEAIPPALPPVEIVPSGSSHLSLLQELIPENINSALSQNFVPAIFVFALSFGVAIQAISAKTAFLEVMEVIRRASLQIWTWVVYLSPVGVFALFASTTGTIAPQMADQLAVYVGLYLIGTFTLAFIILPLALSGIAPVSPRELLSELQPAFVLALVTTLPTTALPLIQGVAERMAIQVGQKSGDGPGPAADEEAKDITRATISLAYVFGSVGNYFTALFIIYMAHYYRITVDTLQAALLPFLTLLSCNGSPSTTIAAVSFMSKWLGMPASTVSVYIEAITITRYGQVALSVAAYAFVAIAVTLVYFRRIFWRPKRVLTTLAIGLLFFAGIAIGARLLSDRLFPPPDRAAVFGYTLDPALRTGAYVTIQNQAPSTLPPISGPATLDGIRTRGTIRVGYGRNIVPFSYINARGDLVGFDVSYAYKLARDLHVRLELVPIDWGTLETDLTARRFDIVMAGAYVSTGRLENLQVSDSYFQSPVGLIAASTRAPAYLDYDVIARAQDLTLGVLRYPVLLSLATHLLPKARIIALDSYDDLPRHPEIDASLWSLDQARAWAAGHSQYSAVRPAGMGAPLIFAYLLSPNAVDLTRFVDLWLALQASNGFRDAQIAYWIDGERRAPRAPRWNLLDNVLSPELAKRF
jgi:Na+/H+-dicarboxylate symporter/ABC-type amino acid transport substrate-binding protein